MQDISKRLERTHLENIVLGGVVKADEDLLCRRILDYAKELYKKTENQRAFEDWLARRNESQPDSEQQYGER